MKSIKIGIVGVGYLGAFHAQKCANMSNAELVAVSDTNVARCDEIAAQYHAQKFPDYKDMLGHVDAVIIVVPAIYHFEVAKFFLENGVHVFLEKPMTTNAIDAQTLMAISQQKGCLLQAGFIERFNPVTQYIKEIIHEPLLIETARMAPFSIRGTDVSVILDLMIHDIDLLHYLFATELDLQNAQGACVQSEQVDEARAKFYLKNNQAEVYLSASRVSPHKYRTMRIVEKNKTIHADFGNGIVDIYHTSSSQAGLIESTNIHSQRISLPKIDLLQEELKSFLMAIQLKQEPFVPAMAGQAALMVARQVQSAIFQPQQTLFGQVVYGEAFIS